jgi:hypothetical protein
MKYVDYRLVVREREYVLWVNWLEGLIHFILESSRQMMDRMRRPWRHPDINQRRASTSRAVSSRHSSYEEHTNTMISPTSTPTSSQNCLEALPTPRSAMKRRDSDPQKGIVHNYSVSAQSCRRNSISVTRRKPTTLSAEQIRISQKTTVAASIVKPVISFDSGTSAASPFHGFSFNPNSKLRRPCSRRSEPVVCDTGDNPFDLYTTFKSDPAATSSRQQQDIVSDEKIAESPTWS